MARRNKNKTLKRVHSMKTRANPSNGDNKTPSPAAAKTSVRKPRAMSADSLNNWLATPSPSKKKRAKKPLQQSKKQQKTASFSTSLKTAPPLNCPPKVKKKVNTTKPSIKEQTRRSEQKASAARSKDHDNVERELPPWIKTFRESHAPASSNHTSSRKRKRQSHRLPTDDVAESTLSALSQELRAFGQYVQLTDLECQARNGLLSELNRLLPSEHSLEVFGSFATRDVCVYNSDMDVALWGAVHPERKRTPLQHPTEASRNTTQTRSERCGDAVTETTNKKEERIKRWKEAMAEHERLQTEAAAVTAAVESDVVLATLDRGNASAPDSAPRKNSVGSEATETTASGNTLFVVDRVGGLPNDVAKKDSSHPVSLSSSSSNDDDDSADPLTNLRERKTNIKLEVEATQNMEVSFFATAPTRSITKTSSGPTGRIREHVLNALGAFRTTARLCRQVTKVNFITRARVPILKIATIGGVEVDVAVGGHNGTDTTHFASIQTDLYHSFAIVVVFLKVLLHQHNLDTPFTGGLGSYKLYVLVAIHIQEHLQLGGQDTPGEILLTFLFRYGNVKGHNVDESCRTWLKQSTVLEYRQTTSFADMSNVFHLPFIIQLFKRSWDKLWKYVLPNGDIPSNGMLTQLIEVAQLERERIRCQQRSSESIMSFKEGGGNRSNKRPFEENDCKPAASKRRRWN